MRKYFNATMWAVGAVCIAVSVVIGVAYAASATFDSVRIGPDGAGVAPLDTLDFVNPDGNIDFALDGNINTNRQLRLTAGVFNGSLENATELIMTDENAELGTSGYASLIALSEDTEGMLQANCLFLGDTPGFEESGLPTTAICASNGDAVLFSVAEIDSLEPASEVRVNRSGEAFVRSNSGAEVFVDGGGNAGLMSAAEDGTGVLVAQSSVMCLPNGDVVVQLGPIE